MKKDSTPEGREIDWLHIAKMAGKHGVRYRTNSALLDFLSAIATPEPRP